MRILFAEDDRDLNRAVKTLLERSGYQVDPVFNGADAASYAAAEAASDSLRAYRASISAFFCA